MLAYAKSLLSGRSWRSAPKQLHSPASEELQPSGSTAPAAAAQPNEIAAVEQAASTPAETAAADNAQHRQEGQPVAEQQQQQQQKPLELEDIFAVGTLIGNRYQVLKKLGDGGTADVFECTDLFVGDTVAVKVVRLAVTDRRGVLPVGWGSSRLYGLMRSEADTYQRLLSANSKDVPLQGIPRMRDFEHKWVSPVRPGSQDAVVYSYMSMQLLGTPVDMLARRLVYLADSGLFVEHASSMLQALQCMHTHGLVHGDVKTANFCTAVKDGVNKENHARTPSAVYIMDMGFAEDFTRLSGKALDTACNASYKGTVDYSSLRSLAGYPNTPLDDLFSLGDCMLEMLLGDLPWDVCKEVEDNKQYNRSTITTTTKGAGGSPKQNLPWPQNVLPQLAAAKEAAVARCLQQDTCPAVYRSWHAYLSTLGPLDDIDYKYLQHLVVTAGEQEQARQQQLHRQRQQPLPLGKEFSTASIAAAASAAVSCTGLQAPHSSSSRKRSTRRDDSCCQGMGDRNLLPAGAAPEMQCTPAAKKQRRQSVHASGVDGYDTLSPLSEE